MRRDGWPFRTGRGGCAALALMMSALWPSAALADEPATPAPSASAPATSAAAASAPATSAPATSAAAASAPSAPAPATSAAATSAAANGGSDPGVSQCIAAHAEVQRLRKAHRLIAARRTVTDCTRPQCPVPVLRECAAWIDELEKVTPSVIFNVTSESGQITGSKIVVDGQEVDLPSSGVPLSLDPGRHTYRVEQEGYRPVTREFVVFEGQRFVQLDIALVPLVAPVAPQAKARATESYRPVPALTYVLAGVGVAGAAGFAVLGMMGSSELDNLERTCMPRCKDSDVAQVEWRYMAADIALGVGAAGLAGAALTYLLRPTEERPVVVSVMPSSAGVFGSVMFRGM
ncbi:PEGA domain-containing protein [Sorangium cellulosum]|nr:PEGA domain-containing protein [Sorangium cellulosum]